MTKTKTRYTHRHIVRLTVEAATPLAVGTGKGSDILTDAPVAKDVNGLPYIPATSIAGVLRHAMGYTEDKTEDNPFGYISKSDDNDDSGHGSDIIFTDAVMVGKDGKALDGIQDIDWNDEFYRYFQDLPVRQHVRIMIEARPKTTVSLTTKSCTKAHASSSKSSLYPKKTPTTSISKMQLSTCATARCA